MKKLLSGLLVLGLAFAFGMGATGCKKGTANNGNRSQNSGGGDKVEYSLSTKNLDLTPTQTSEVTLTRSGNKAKWGEQEVKVKSSDTARVTAEAVKFTKEGEKATITLRVPGDATPGEAKVEVSVGTEFKGEVTVKVEKAKQKGGNGGDNKKNPKTTYKYEPAETGKVAAGKTAEIKITREGGNLEAQNVEAKVEGNNKVTIESVKKFEAKGTEASVTVKADPKATGDATIKITIGSETHSVKITVEKSAQLRLPSRHLARGTPDVQLVPQARAAVRRDLILFTRKS